MSLGNADGEHDGYDLVGAFVGSEGCFGIALDITVRLSRNPEAVRTLLADFMSLDAAARAVSAIVATGIVPAALEMIDQATIRAVESSIYAAGYPTDAAAALLIELDGAAAGLERDVATVESARARSNGARTVRVARDDAERARLWQGRKKAFGAMGRRVVAPRRSGRGRAAHASFLKCSPRFAEIGERQRVRICNVFHAGDGNLHPNIPYDASDPDETARVHLAMREIMTACVDAGGTITGEHGVGLDKLPYMDLIFSPDSLATMCALREVFDPDRRSNPGKVVPMHACREWHMAPSARAGHGCEHDCGGRSIPSARCASGCSTPTQRRATLRIAGQGTWLDAGRPARRTRDRLDARARRESRSTFRATSRSRREPARRWPRFAMPRRRTASGWRSIRTAPTTARSARRSPRRRPGRSPRRSARRAISCSAWSSSLGTGVVARGGGRVVKNVAGFDLTRLLTGSWGTLGVLTEVTVRLHARARGRRDRSRSRWMTPGAAGRVRRAAAASCRSRRMHARS